MISEVERVATAGASVWAARGNRTVDLRRLAGPLRGHFVPPPHLEAKATRSRYALAERAERIAAYALLLSHGTAEDVTCWVNLDELARCFDELRLPRHVLGPWRKALREAGVLPKRRSANPTLSTKLTATDLAARGPARRAVEPVVLPAAQGSP